MTGLVFNTAGLAAYYIREGDASETAITLVTATVGTYTSGGFKQVNAGNMPGAYELHLPNAATAAGAKSVMIELKGAATMAALALEIELDGVDYQDATRFGLSALPSAVPGAAGGLFIAGANAATAVNLTGNVTGNLSGSVGSVTTEGTLIRGGTAQAGSSTTITLDSGASGLNSFYNAAIVKIDSGAGAGQVRVISGYVGSTKVATVAPAWITNPSGTSVFRVLAVYTPSVDSTGAVTSSAISSSVQDAIVARVFNALPTSFSLSGSFGQLLQRIGTGQASIFTPVIRGKDIELVIGDDYTSVPITLIAPDAGWPVDPTLADSVHLIIATSLDDSTGVSITGTVTDATHVHFNPSSSQTLTLLPGAAWDYRVVSTKSGADNTLAYGRCRAIKKIG